MRHLEVELSAGTKFLLAELDTGQEAVQKAEDSRDRGKLHTIIGL